MEAEREERRGWSKETKELTRKRGRKGQIDGAKRRERSDEKYEWGKVEISAEWMKGIKNKERVKKKRAREDGGWINTSVFE